MCNSVSMSYSFSTDLCNKTFKMRNVAHIEITELLFVTLQLPYSETFKEPNSP